MNSPKSISIGLLSSLVALLCLSGVSSGAVVTVPDTAGPRMLSATVLVEPLRTNRIQIAWDEPIQLPGSLTASFQVILAGSNVLVAIANGSYNPGTYPLPGIPPTMTLTMSTTHWHYGSNYYILANNVRDSRGNYIAPNSIVGVTWPGLPPAPLPPSATPVLSIERFGPAGIRISWPTNAYGYALDWATNVTINGTNSVAGPWSEVQPLLGNPYFTTPASETHRIYRLRKP